MTTDAAATGAPTSNAYFTRFLQGLGITPTPGAIAALESVEHYEGDNNRYNPLNTIQQEPGSTKYNSVGVQTYADFETGVEGGVALFSGSHWDAVRQALATGNTSGILAAFDAGYTWSPGTKIPQISGATLAAEDSRLVGGSSGTVVNTSGGTSGIVSGSSGASTGVLGTVTGALNGLNDLMPWSWASDLSSGESSLAKLVITWTLKLAFIGGGITLAVLGAYETVPKGDSSSKPDPAELAALA